MNMRGLGLVELLVVLVIIGILLAAGLPGYRQSTLVAGRTEGRELLLRVAADQAMYYSRELRYSEYAAPLATPPQILVRSPGGRYEVSVAPCTGGSFTHCFIATAEAIGAQRSDNCALLTVSNTGIRGGSEGCW